METICLVLDAQGFYVNNYFYPRELAIAELNDSDIESYESMPAVKFPDLPFHERKLNDFIMNYTGLPYNSFNPHLPEDKIKILIAMVYTKNRSEEKPNLGIRNEQFGRYLKSMGIPFIQIKSPSIYTLKKLYPKDINCGRHILNGEGVCSVYKVKILRSWVLDNLKY